MILQSYSGGLYPSGSKLGATSQIQGFTNGIYALADSGFGTASPVSNVHVHQTDSGESVIRFTNTTSGATASDGLYLGLDSSERGAIWLYENADIYLGTNNAERMRIKADGKISFGGASATQALNIANYGPTVVRMAESTANSYVGLLWGNDSNSIAMYYGGTTQGSIPDQWAFYVNSTHTGYIWRIDGDGNMCIGQDSETPTGAFQIISSSDSRLYLGKTTNATVWSGYIRVMRYVNSSAGGIEVHNASGTRSQVLTWDGRGRIGIMTGLAGVNYTFEVLDEIAIKEQLSSDPSDPAAEGFVIWASDGTDSGDDGDIMFKVANAAGTVKTGTLVDYSAV